LACGLPASGFYLGTTRIASRRPGLVIAGHALRRERVLFSVNAAVLNFNLYGGPLNVVPASSLSQRGFCRDGVALVTKRGAELPRHAEVVEVEEVHSSPLWALVFAVLTR